MAMDVSKRVVEGSCWTCKKRRLKCDLTRPICGKCLTSSSPCSYTSKQLQWVGGAAVRGRLKSMGPSTAFADALRTRRASAPETGLVICNATMMLPPSPCSASPTLPASLLMYFRNAVWPRLQLSEHPIELDDAMLIHEPVLLEAILAVSQAHHHLLLASENSCTVTPESQNLEGARRSALAKLRSRIECGTGSVEDARQLLEIVCIFCILDGVISPGEDSDASEQHLRGGCSILAHWETVTSKMLLAGGLQAYLLTAFATMDLVRSMLSGHRPFFEPTTWPMFAGVKAWWGDLACGDPFLALLKTYSELAYIGSMVHSHLSSNEAHFLAEKCLPGLWLSLEVANMCASCPDFTTPEEWTAFCALYRAAAIVYIYRALQNRSIDDDSVQAVVRTAVSSLVDRPLAGMMTHCLILPLVVIGSHCLYTQDVRAISCIIASSTSYLAFGNTILMTAFLENVWRHTEKKATWWDMFKPLSKNVFLF
ncbi:hypothetical protein DOTSEDRAFT_156493 [Dothistroma septosporum NZE10]|uniref:Zn(2)-C6 fungal-type domain-containing protein n=1 Tax=Dothistroma septosporum (strain NZE10 / CBS 128990) TaxID=675120 RepID=N1PHE1_DOTSN|nr:hypothetical protein DOTSEDRAFT_156493 [Dothistroma septosporum NZE10]